MTFLPRYCLILLLTWSLAGLHALAQSTIIQSGSFADVSDPANQTLTINQFDSSQGTLTSVEIEMSDVYIDGTASVTNNNNNRHSFTISLAGDYSITDSTGNTVDVSLTTASHNSGNLYRNQTYTTPTETNSTPGSGSITFSDSTSLTPYIGTGTTTLTLASDNSVTLSSGTGNYSLSQTSTGSGSYTVIYTYTPVPEPSQTAACMLGFGLCLLLGRMYLKRRVDESL